MKKCKKILALVLAGVLAIGMLAGCGSAASSGTNDNITPDKGVVTTTVNKSLKNLKVDFKSDSTFASQLAIVANSATQEDVKGLNGAAYLTGSAQGALAYVTKATWMNSAPSQAGTYVCGIWFDGGKSAEEVGVTVASYLDLASGITKDFKVTKASIETYKVTMGTGGSEKSVWLVGVLVTLADRT